MVLSPSWASRVLFRFGLLPKATLASTTVVSFPEFCKTAYTLFPPFETARALGLRPKSATVEGVGTAGGAGSGRGETPTAAPWGGAAKALLWCQPAYVG